MINSISIPIGYTTVVTNANGSTTTTTLMRAQVHWGIEPTLAGWFVFAFLIAIVALWMFYPSKNNNPN
jgi:hypothetical protein